MQVTLVRVASSCILLACVLAISSCRQNSGQVSGSPSVAPKPNNVPSLLPTPASEAPVTPVSQGSIIACDVRARMVVSIDPDTGEKRELTAAHGATGFAIAPSGDRIACAPTAGLSGSTITIIDVAGSVTHTADMEQLCPKQIKARFYRMHGIAWHPKGNKLLIGMDLGSNMSYQSVLATYDIGTTKLKLLSEYRSTSLVAGIEAASRGEQTHDTDTDDSGGAFSPDGKKIAFRRATDIYIATADLGSPNMISQQLDTGGTSDYGQRVSKYAGPFWWSPDGSAVLCCGTGGVAKIMATDGTIRTTIDGLLVGACWSPDGSKVAGFREDGGEGALWTYDISTSTWCEVTSKEEPLDSDCQFAWGVLKEPTKGDGQLSIASATPGAKIILDGSVTGKVTPHTFTLDSGPHKVVLQKDGRNTREQTIVVRARSVVTCKVADSDYQ